MENFYGHKSAGLDIDVISKEFMVSGGFDKRPIIWKIPQESQLIFRERNSAQDCVRGINPTHFVTGSQEGEVCLWTTAKINPIHKLRDCHEGGWIGAMVGLKLD